ncbi:MAG: hypothetical protein E4H36_00140 [Spirochaetales bacterium]|nr:MAG: hypothetical protein E4H36_00140 [Spirochaetales bacterium]
MKNHKYLLPILLVIIAPVLSSLENVSVDLHLLITGTKSAGIPFEFEQKVIFSYKGDYQNRFVGVAFDYELYREIHPFFRNENGVFMFVLPYNEIPEDITDITYRIIADGLWIPDPVNPWTFREDSGIKVSRISLRYRQTVKEYPYIDKKDGIVTFVFNGPGSNNVFLAGSFNNWDPFMFPMEESAAGYYTLKLRLMPGTHYYYFLYNGEKRRDTRNPGRAIDPEGFAVSVVTVP